MRAQQRHSHREGNLNASTIESLITNNIDTWVSVIKQKSGRGSSKKIELYGIKKLRELIIELAVRGKLVAQDPTDQPASVLLERIAAERAQLVKDLKIKKPKKLPEISEDKKPFDLPRGWKWAYLADTGITSTGKTPSTKNPELFKGNIPFIGPGQISLSGKILPADKYLSKNGLLHSAETNSGDILMVCIGGSIGKAAISIQQAGFNQQINCISPLKILNTYLYLAISSKSFYSSLLDKASGSVTPIINRSKWEKLLVPVAPKHEQLRIVAKVDLLMALCEQLEQQTESSLDAHKTLVKVLLATLTDSKNVADLNKSWNRIREFFVTLFTTEHSLEQLKKTILQLAVMGKLVPQNPSDQPASKLLARIAVKKSQLIADKKIKKQKSLAPITQEEKLFILPNGWAWVRLQDSIDVRDGTHYSPKNAFGENTVPLVTSKDFSNGEINFKTAKRISESDHLEISKRSLVEVDDILFSMIGGNIGNQVMVKDKISFSIKNVALFKYYDKKATLPAFFKIYTEDLASRLQQESSGGAQPFVSLGKLRNLVYALPPYSEQIRIVAKIGELFLICDQLKSRLHKVQKIQVNLADAIIDQAI